MKKYTSILHLAFLIIAIQFQNGYSQDGTDRFLNWLIDDPVTMFTDFNQSQIYSMVSVGIGVTAISLGDQPSSRHFQQQYSQSNMLHFANRWGELKIAGAASVGIFATSLLTNDEKFQDAAFTTFQTLLMTKITVNTAKFIFGRERPYDQEGPYDFDPVQMGGTSFPSGHTATAFALVTPWVIYYPGPVTYSLMAIPVGTAIARVAKGKHWLSDVTAGAAIGFSIGQYLAKKHLNLQSERVQLMPSTSYDQFSMTLNISF